MGLKDAVFGSEGKKKEKTESGNHAWDPIKGAFTPALGYVTQGGNAVANLLGVGGGDQTGALSNFANSGGFKFLLDEGTDSINSNFYARGLGESGAAMKGLEKYRSGLASTYLQQYTDNLLNLAKLGLGAGGVMADAGRWSKGESKGTTGKDGILDDALKAAAASDPRLKENIVFAGTDDAGINFYYFDYKQDTPLNLPTGRHYGVLADEVPSSMTIKKNGYLHVTNPAYFPRKV